MWRCLQQRKQKLWTVVSQVDVVGWRRHGFLCLVSEIDLTVQSEGDAAYRNAPRRTWRSVGLEEADRIWSSAIGEASKTFTVDA